MFLKKNRPRKIARALMFQGTGSDVGKTLLVAGLCRAARNRGLSVLPFKPQNMSNNAAVAKEEGEIGRGQWLQAFAAGVDPSVHMNPILLKPQSKTGAQLIVQGKVYGLISGVAYQEVKETLINRVLQSYHHLKKKAEFILVEGAGSAAEINLRLGDIANMGFATTADVPVILVGDIDRGGVIASLVGTHTVLSEQDRRMVVGYLINKFRGDQSLFSKGITAITNYTGWPSFGIIPWFFEAALLPAEDSFMLGVGGLSGHNKGRIRISVPLFPHVANFDDLDPLKHEKDVELIFIQPGQKILESHALILLGSKSTLSDMKMFHEYGWSRDVHRHVENGGEVIGLCGGFQMLGKKISDPFGYEGNLREIPGLGLLDIETVIGEKKIVRSVKGYISSWKEDVYGYEIHSGTTTGKDCMRAPVLIEGRADGAASSNGRIWGTYLHGIFFTGGGRHKFLQKFGGCSDHRNHLEKVDNALNKIARNLEKVLDVDAIFSTAR